MGQLCVFEHSDPGHENGLIFVFSDITQAACAHPLHKSVRPRQIRAFKQGLL